LCCNLFMSLLFLGLLHKFKMGSFFTIIHPVQFYDAEGSFFYFFTSYSLLSKMTYNLERREYDP